MMKAFLSLDVELKNELMTTVRLATGGASSFAGLSYDDGEDCKVCVTESLLLLAHAHVREARISFYRENGLQVRIEGNAQAENGRSEGDEISIALINALAGDVVMERTGDMRKISFRFAALK